MKPLILEYSDFELSKAIRSLKIEIAKEVPYVDINRYAHFNVLVVALNDLLAEQLRRK